MLSLLLVTVAIGHAAAKFAFPVPSHYSSEASFKTRNPEIKWDPTNLLSDLAGPIALCDRLAEAAWGQASKKVTNDVAETAWKAQKIDPVFFPEKGTYYVYYFVLNGSGGDARSVDADLRAEISRHQNAQFRLAPLTQLGDDIGNSARFGCSVEPMCPGTTKTIAVCLFQEIAGPKPFWVRGFNETWDAHAHDIYNLVAQYTFDGSEFPGYIYFEDETVVNTTIGQDLCDKHVYDPNGFVSAVRGYFNNPPSNNAFQFELGAEKMVGWFLAWVENANASSPSSVNYAKDNTIPAWFRLNVVNKMALNPAPANVLAVPSPKKELNSGACVVAVCPSRQIPRGGAAGGKLDRRGNFFVFGCMTFKTDQQSAE